MIGDSNTRWREVAQSYGCAGDEALLFYSFLAMGTLTELIGQMFGRRFVHIYLIKEMQQREIQQSAKVE